MNEQIYNDYLKKALRIGVSIQNEPVIITEFETVVLTGIKEHGFLTVRDYDQPFRYVEGRSIRVTREITQNTVATLEEYHIYVNNRLIFVVECTEYTGEIEPKLKTFNGVKVHYCGYGASEHPGNYYAWLANLSHGDMVIVSTSEQNYLGKVETVDDNAVYVDLIDKEIDNHYVFDRSDATYFTSGSWDRAYLCKVNNYLMREINDANLRRNTIRLMRETDMEKVSLTTLDKIYWLLKTDKGTDND